MKKSNVPFFARFLENQTATAEKPAGLEVKTELKAGAGTTAAARTLKFPSDRDESIETLKYPSDNDESTQF